MNVPRLLFLLHQHKSHYLAFSCNIVPSWVVQVFCLPDLSHKQATPWPHGPIIPCSMWDGFAWGAPVWIFMFCNAGLPVYKLLYKLSTTLYNKSNFELNSLLLRNAVFIPLLMRPLCCFQFTRQGPLASLIWRNAFHSWQAFNLYHRQEVLDFTPRIYNAFERQLIRILRTLSFYSSN